MDVTKLLNMALPVVLDRAEAKQEHVGSRAGPHGISHSVPGL